MSGRKTDERYKPHERKTKTPEQALGTLQRLAARCEKSSGDARRLMRGWGIEDSEQPRILQTLIDQRFIDDERYAEAYVREKSRLNGWGEYKIRNMLVSKGIAKPVIDRTLRQVQPDAAKNKLAEMLARKMRSAKGSSTGAEAGIDTKEERYRLKGRLMRYGLSLGYDYEEVMNAVERAIDN